MLEAELAGVHETERLTTMRAQLESATKERDEAIYVAKRRRTDLVDSLKHPFRIGLLVGKRLQLLRETVPNAKMIAILANPTQPDLSSKDDLQEVEATARTVGQKIAVFNASSEANFEPAFAAMVRE